MEVLSSVLSLLSTHWVGTLVISLVILFCYWGIAPYRRSAIVAQIGDIPGPPPLPFVGNSLDLFRYKGQMHLQFDDYYKKYGRLFATFIVSRKPYIVIGDLEMVKDLLVKEFQSFHDRPGSVVTLPKPLNSMMTTVTGQTWHRIRSTLSPTFSGHKMKVMVPLLTKSCDVLIKKLQDAEKSDQSVDVYKLVLILILTYLLCEVIFLTLHLSFSGFILARVATKDCTIKGFPIKKGTSIFVPVYSIQRDPEYYDNPDKFDPEHFSAEAKQSRDPYAYMPFGHGPRNCIGMRFAIFQMKMSLARILKQFSLVVGPETKVPLEVKMKKVLGCGKDGIQLRIKSRH
ncbi:cytochrome P450 3A31 [Exaiptasia diaphana]|uniref:Cytochrome P450 n=1 Tax=Exaiptasia diaphana TaxID=2652724 RepID=A0A913YMJ1_EXADI|nr:cytochrome P450 3A31 [Exaiptasia diaphana]